MKTKFYLTALLLGLLVAACEKDDNMEPTPKDPDTSEVVSIDRFSSDFAHLFLRTAENGFPEANEAIDFDAIPAFRTNGLGPNGEKTIYYNFDVLSTIPAPIFVFFREGEDSPVEGQLNIVNVVPGDGGYNDFWLVNKVTVPKSYKANTITSTSEIYAIGYTVKATTTIVNCPIVPKGSVARMRYLSEESTALTRGWYDGKIVFYFNFLEKELTAVNGMIPTSDIFVAFNINPNETGGGPASGFLTEDSTATGQTHNVPESIPEDATYSPLWDVQIYDNSAFLMVSDLSSATGTTILAMDAAIVNCPIVSVKP